MPINAINAPGIFTRGLVQKYQDDLAPRPFFTALARETVDNSKLLHVASRRFDEDVAVDIALGTEGHRNQFTRSTSNLYNAPEYLEYFDMLDLDNFDRVFGGGTNPSESAMADLISEAAAKTAMLENKITRGIERQWAQVMQTGIVVLANNDALDFRRKAGSIVDPGAGGYWDAATPGIITQLTAGCQFIRNTGKSASTDFFAVMGAGAVSAFLNNAEIQNQGDKVLIQRMKIEMPSDMMVGTRYHGSISADDYIVHVLTYPENYDTRDAAGAVTRNAYIDAKNVVIIPREGHAFTTKYGGLPAIMKMPGTSQQMLGRIAQKTRVWDQIDTRRRSHLVNVNSRPIAVPVSVDQIYTIKALA